MKNIMIYPYHNEYETYVENMSVNKKFLVTKLISPYSWGYEGDKIYNGFEYIDVKSDFNNALQQIDVVWFVNDGIFNLPTNIIKEKMENAILNNKQIIYTRYDNEEICKHIPNELNMTPRKMEVEFALGHNGVEYYEIDKPIITIIGTSENTGKFNVQIILKNMLEKIGYRVSGISSKNDSELLGIHSFPDFMKNARLTETEKILWYNHFVKTVDLKENPDVFIISIPGGILPYHSKKYNDFGFRTFEIMSAVHSDCAILCQLLEREYNNLDDIRKEAFNRYRLPIQFYYVTNKFLDTTNILVSNEKSMFVSVDKEYLKEKIVEMELRNFYLLYNEPEKERFVEEIIDFLGD